MLGEGRLKQRVAGESEDQLTEQELFANIVLLLIAGHENSTSLIGNGAAMLLDLPEVRTELARDPSRWPAAIEELMRLVSPNQFIRRQARADVALGDQTIRAGDALLLILAAANRDPKAFPDPDRFVFNRPQTVALGHGIHYCLGAPLARLEGRIALQTVFEGGGTSAKPGTWCTPTTSMCGYCIPSLSPHLEPTAAVEAVGRGSGSEHPSQPASDSPDMQRPRSRAAKGR